MTSELWRGGCFDIYSDDILLMKFVFCILCLASGTPAMCFIHRLNNNNIIIIIIIIIIIKSMVSSLTVSQQIRLGESVVYCVILSMMSYAAPGDVLWSANKGQNVTNKGSIYPFMCLHHQLSSHRHEKNNSKMPHFG